MINKEEWKEIKHFSPDENWGDPYAMDHELVKTLDRFREFIGCSIQINSGNNGVHSDESFHYIKSGSCAVDVQVKDYPNSVIDLLFTIMRFPFTGIGYYPHWKRDGFHLDTRPWPVGARWVGHLVENEEGGVSQEYQQLSFDNLRSHLELAFPHYLDKSKS